MSASPTTDGSPQGAYTGVAGETRIDPMHVTVPGGFVRSIRVHTQVNVATHPELRDAAIQGALHRFEGGEELAVPYIYHDPVEQRFALVLPEVLRHRELNERAQLLERLAEDRAHPIPSYVREAKVVIGQAELATYLEGAGPSVAEQKQVLGDREARLAARAEDITRREDELRAQGDLIDAQQRDLALREQELEARLQTLQQREQEFASRTSEGRSTATYAASPSVMVPSESATVVTQWPPRDAELASPSEQQTGDIIVEDEEIEELEDLEPLRTNAALVPEAYALADEAEELPAVEERAELDETGRFRAGGEIEELEAELLEDAVEELVDEAEVEELRESSPELGQDPAPTPKPGSDVTSALVAELFADRERQIAAAVLDDRVALAVKVAEGREEAFREGADLLVQFAPVDGWPIVLLTLIEERQDGRRPYLRRLALDPSRSPGDRILQQLRIRGEVAVETFSRDREPLHTFELDVPRRVNVALLLERLGRWDQSSEVDVGVALERALAAPPPTRLASHPFTSEDPEPATGAVEARRRLLEALHWNEPSKLEMLLLTLSVPKDVVDGALRRYLLDAVRAGIMVPAEFRSRAVSLGVAPDGAALVEETLAAFRTTATSEDRSGLSKEQVAENWKMILEAAGEEELEVPDDLRELATEQLSEAPPAETDGATLDLEAMGPPELVLLLDRPAHRLAAAQELVKRRDAELLPVIVAAVRKMPRDEVITVVGDVLTFGDEAGDALIDALGAKKTFVRQAASLALGKLKLRRAIHPLVHLLQDEESDVWVEVARVLGSFGAASLRPLSRAAKSSKRDPERLGLALAHAAEASAKVVKELEKLGDDAERSVALVALEALRLRPEARRLKAKVLGDETPSPEEPVLQFSRQFLESI